MTTFSDGKIILPPIYCYGINRYCYGINQWYQPLQVKMGLLETVSHITWSRSSDEFSNSSWIWLWELYNENTCPSYITLYFSSTESAYGRGIYNHSMCDYILERIPDIFHRNVKKYLNISKTNRYRVPHSGEWGEHSGFPLVKETGAILPTTWKIVWFPMSHAVLPQKMLIL